MVAGTTSRSKDVVIKAEDEQTRVGKICGGATQQPEDSRNEIILTFVTRYTRSSFSSCCS